MVYLVCVVCVVCVVYVVYVACVVCVCRMCGVCRVCGACTVQCLSLQRDFFIFVLHYLVYLDEDINFEEYSVTANLTDMQIPSINTYFHYVSQVLC